MTQAYNYTSPDSRATEPVGTGLTSPARSRSSSHSTHASRNAPKLTAMSATLNVDQRVISLMPTSMKSITPSTDVTRSMRLPSAPPHTSASAITRDASPARVIRYSRARITGQNSAALLLLRIFLALLTIDAISRMRERVESLERNLLAAVVTLTKGIWIAIESPQRLIDVPQEAALLTREKKRLLALHR